MGRTQLPVTPQFEKELRRLSKFRRALRRADQLAFDDLFAMARKHLSAVGHAAHPVPLLVFLVGILLEQYKEVARLRDEVGELRRLLDD